VWHPFKGAATTPPRHLIKNREMSRPHSYCGYVEKGIHLSLLSVRFGWWSKQGELARGWIVNLAPRSIISTTCSDLL